MKRPRMRSRRWWRQRPPRRAPTRSTRRQLLPARSGAVLAALTVWWVLRALLGVFACSGWVLGQIRRVRTLLPFAVRLLQGCSSRRCRQVRAAPPHGRLPPHVLAARGGVAHRGRHRRPRAAPRRVGRLPHGRAWRRGGAHHLRHLEAPSLVIRRPARDDVAALLVLELSFRRRRGGSHRGGHRSAIQRPPTRPSPAGIAHRGLLAALFFKKSAKTEQWRRSAHAMDL